MVDQGNKREKNILSIQLTVKDVIDEAFDMMRKIDYTSYILFLGKAAVIPGLKALCGTDCVVDYMLDSYHDKTRIDFYLRYLRRNYSKEGFRYEGERGLDDIHIELMIYAHLWDSTYFLKSLVRIAGIVSKKGYIWDLNVNWRKKEKKMKDCIIDPLKNDGLKLGDFISKCYDSRIRNAFAHSQYSIDYDRRVIIVRCDDGVMSLKFEEFQNLFLRSVILMNKMENALEFSHNDIAKKGTALTEIFKTPDGLDVQVYGRMVTRGKIQFPEFRLVRIKDE